MSAKLLFEDISRVPSTAHVLIVLVNLRQQLQTRHDVSKGAGWDVKRATTKTQQFVLNDGKIKSEIFAQFLQTTSRRTTTPKSSLNFTRGLWIYICSSCLSAFHYFIFSCSFFFFFFLIKTAKRSRTQQKSRNEY